MHEHHRRFRFCSAFRILTATTTLAATALVGPGFAQEVPSHEGPPVRIQSSSEALQADARYYASMYNVSIEEAVRRLRAEHQAADVVGRLREATRGRLAGLWIEHQPEFRIVVRLAGDAPAPPEFQAAATGSPIPVVFTTGATTTQEQILAKIQASLPQFRTVLPGLTATDMDVQTGEIVLFVHAVGAAAEVAKAQGAELARQIGHPVRIETLAVPEQDQHTRGGADIIGCTAGFVVQNSAGTRGVSTAAHCDNTQTYYEFGGTSYSITWVAGKLDADHDVQWHTTSHDEYPEFYADLTTSARVLTGRRYRSSTSVGNTVCHRGNGTGYSCGSVASTTHQPTYTNACGSQTCNPVYIRVSGADLLCYGGDSGGPWFNGQTAFGIHKSGASSGPAKGDCSYAVYMSTDYLSGLGVSLVYGQ